MGKAKRKPKFAIGELLVYDFEASGEVLTEHVEVLGNKRVGNGYQYLIQFSNPDLNEVYPPHWAKAADLQSEEEFNIQSAMPLSLRKKKTATPVLQPVSSSKKMDSERVKKNLFPQHSPIVELPEPGTATPITEDPESVKEAPKSVPEVVALNTSVKRQLFPGGEGGDREPEPLTEEAAPVREGDGKATTRVRDGPQPKFFVGEDVVYAWETPDGEGHTHACKIAEIEKGRARGYKYRIDFCCREKNFQYPERWDTADNIWSLVEFNESLRSPLQRRQKTPGKNTPILVPRETPTAGKQTAQKLPPTALEEKQTETVRRSLMSEFKATETDPVPGPSGHAEEGIESLSEDSLETSETEYLMEEGLPFQPSAEFIEEELLRSRKKTEKAVAIQSFSDESSDDIIVATPIKTKQRRSRSMLRKKENPLKGQSPSQTCEGGEPSKFPSACNTWERDDSSSEDEGDLESTRRQFQGFVPRREAKSCQRDSPTEPHDSDTSQGEYCRRKTPGSGPRKGGKPTDTTDSSSNDETTTPAKTKDLTEKLCKALDSLRDKQVDPATKAALQKPLKLAKKLLPPTVERQYPCAECGTILKDKRSVKRHYDRFHKNKKMPPMEDEKKFDKIVCPQRDCGKLVSKANFKRHCNRNHAKSKILPQEGETLPARAAKQPTQERRKGNGTAETLAKPESRRLRERGSQKLRQILSSSSNEDEDETPDQRRQRKNLEAFEESGRDEEEAVDDYRPTDEESPSDSVTDTESDSSSDDSEKSGNDRCKPGPSKKQSGRKSPPCQLELDKMPSKAKDLASSKVFYLELLKFGAVNGRQIMTSMGDYVNDIERYFEYRRRTTDPDLDPDWFINFDGQTLDLEGQPIAGFSTFPSPREFYRSLGTAAVQAKVNNSLIKCVAFLQDRVSCRPNKTNEYLQLREKTHLEGLRREMNKMGKEFERQRTQQRIEDRETRMCLDEYPDGKLVMEKAAEWDESEHKRDMLKAIKEYPRENPNNFTPCQMRDFLVMDLMIQVPGTRPDAIRNLRRKHLYNAKEIWEENDDRNDEAKVYNIRQDDHKTAKQSVVQMPVHASTYKAMHRFYLHIRKDMYTKVFEASDLLFPTQRGGKLRSVDAAMAQFRRITRCPDNLDLGGMTCRHAISEWINTHGNESVRENIAANLNHTKQTHVAHYVNDASQLKLDLKNYVRSKTKRGENPAVADEIENMYRADPAADEELERERAAVREEAREEREAHRAKVKAINPKSAGRVNRQQLSDDERVDLVACFTQHFESGTINFTDIQEAMSEKKNKKLRKLAKTLKKDGFETKKIYQTFVSSYRAYCIKKKKELAKLAKK